jgi:hypothetical protein
MSKPRRHYLHWTAKEDAWLKGRYSRSEPLEVLSKILHRTAATIRVRASWLGLKRVTWSNKIIGNQYGHFGRWGAEEDAWIKKHYPNCELPDEFAKKMGRGRTALASRARHLGVRRSDKAYRSGMSKSLMGKNKGRPRPDLGAWCKAHPMPGRKNHFYGKHHTEETRAKLSAHQKRIGTFKRLSKDKEFQRRRLAALVKRPNKCERILGRIIERACPGEYRYTGDGSFIVDGLNPDWVNANGKKKIIELFGDPFHDPTMTGRKIPWRSTEVGRRRAFRKFGYDTLVIWATEVYSLIRSDKFHPRLVNKIRRFTCA